MKIYALISEWNWLTALLYYLRSAFPALHLPHRHRQMNFSTHSIHKRSFSSNVLQKKYYQAQKSIIKTSKKQPLLVIRLMRSGKQELAVLRGWFLTWLKIVGFVFLWTEQTATLCSESRRNSTRLCLGIKAVAYQRTRPRWDSFLSKYWSYVCFLT